jgi:hypothetical protein
MNGPIWSLWARLPPVLVMAQVNWPQWWWGYLRRPGLIKPNVSSGSKRDSRTAQAARQVYIRNRTMLRPAVSKQLFVGASRLLASSFSDATTCSSKCRQQAYLRRRKKNALRIRSCRPQLCVTGYFRARAAGGGVRGALHDHDFKFQERPLSEVTRPSPRRQSHSGWPLMALR